MSHKLLLILFPSLFFLAACGLAFPQRTPNFGGNPFGGYTSNGERIYLTGTNDSGKRVSSTGGPSFGGMMGSQLACASCHGANGRGGTHLMHMQAMDAPDIRFVTLSGEEVSGTPNDPGHEGEHPGEYMLATFRQAVVEGQHPDGELLSREMPRWNLTDEDLADLFEFIKTLP